MKFSIFCLYLVAYSTRQKLPQWMLLATTKANTVTRHSDILTALETTVMTKSKLYYKLYIQSLQ